jgi:ABC-type multidrug transport system fused ATPase/permease subunit
VRSLPLTDPGDPVGFDVSSPLRFIRWIARRQRSTLAGGIAFGVIWMLCQAVVPFEVGRAIDRGISDHSTAQLLCWSGALLATGLIQAGASVMRHRFAITNWMIATFRIEQLLTRKVVALGGTLTRRVDLGDVLSSATTDANYIGSSLDVIARLVGAMTAFVAVSVIMLLTSVELGLVVLIGVPLLSLAIAPLIRPLHHRQTALRASVSLLTSFGADTVAGLRVLRGVGGETEFVARYRIRSQDVRRGGVAVAAVESILDAAQVLLPGFFVVALTWLGARQALEHRLSVGQLVSFYGYAAFLLSPMKIATEAGNRFTRAAVGARRVLKVLVLQPELADPEQPAELPDSAELVDPISGFRLLPNEFMAVASLSPADASRLVDRLARYVESDPPVTLGGVPLTELPLATVRRHVVVADNAPRLFSGRLRDQLDPHGLADDDEIAAAIEAASARDAIEALPGGLDGSIDERARTLSGGQRQRLVLVRALLADPPMLLLDEPTSAVDAYTEARIADVLAAFRSRRGPRATAVMTTSPLVLDRVDRVVVLDGDHVVASGSHRQLMATNAAYRSLISRLDDLEAPA